MNDTAKRAAVLGLAALCLIIDAARHVDDSDAGLYTVVARHMVEDGTWTDLRYLENVHPQYREHLPFGLWPAAVTIRVAGERALPFLGAVWTLLTIALVIELGRKLVSPEVGLLAGLVLATTERFIAFGAMHRLDPPLIFFGLLACVPLIFEWRDARGFALMAISAAIACLIKGPFGLVLPVAMTLGLAIARRDLKWLAFGAAACVAALLPLAAFLALADATWREGYLQRQLLASATASRTDGETSPLATLLALGALCWPWLPFAIPWRRKFELRVVIATGATLLFLALAGRKLPHHVLLVFPFVALLAAHNLWQWPPRVLRGLIVLAFLGGPIAVVLNPPPRAVSCTRFSEPLSALPPGAHVTVVATSDGRQWRELATLAAEFKLQPWLTGARDQVHPATALILESVDGEWKLTPPP